MPYRKRQSLQTTLTLLVLSSVVSIVLLIGSSTFLFLVSYQKASNAIILNERCQREASVLELHFNSLRQSVNAIATYARNNAFGHLNDLAGSPDFLLRYQDSLDKLLDVAANNTQDVLISYYALNSDYLPGVPGTWLTRKSADLPFQKMPVPDHRLFDGINQSGWWYVPERARKAVFFGPYFSAHANRLVLTYAVPIYEQGICICVAGISFDYRTMATYLDAINEMKGHAILLDDADNIIYAPDMEIGTPLFAQIPGLVSIKDFPGGSGDKLVPFKQDGKRMSAAYRRLSNGMGLLLVVPDSSLYGESNLLGIRILLIMALTLAVAGFTSFSKLKRLFSPLNELNEAMDYVVTCMITTSVRDATINNVEIHTGDYIGFAGKTMMTAQPDCLSACEAVLPQLGLEEKFALTLFVGANADKGDLEILEKYIADNYPDIEVFKVDGGQEVYDYIMVAE